MADSWAAEWRPLLLPSQGPQGTAVARTTWAAPHPSHGASKQVEMVSFGVDPQWGGLLFSLCSRHEDAGAVLGAGGGVLFPNVLADPLAASAAVPGAGGDLVNVLGSGVLDLHGVTVSSVWAIILETAKATGMVVLLGVGSLLFYRVFHSIRSRLHGLKATIPGRASRAGRRPSPASRRPSSRPLASSASGEESDGESSEEEAAAAVRGFETLAEDVEVTGLYFGPSRRPEPQPDADGGPGLQHPQPRQPGRPAGVAASKAAALRRARRLSRRWESGVVSMDDEARDADVSEGSRSPRTPPEERVSGAWRGTGPQAWRGGAALYRRPGWRQPGARAGSNTSNTSNASTPCSTRSTSSSSSFSPEYPPHRHHSGNQESPTRRRYRRHHREAVSLSREDSEDPREAVMRRGLAAMVREDSADALARRFMARDESFESLFACQQATYSGRGSRSLSRNPSMDSLAAAGLRRLQRDESLASLASLASLDSLGFPRRALTRGSSFDSTCSELSLDVSLIAEAEGLAEGGGGAATLDQLEQLQREIEQLKSNCLSLDEELETVRCNRNLPGMSSLLEVKAEPRPGAAAAEEDAEAVAERARARACFAGLYSLTRITSSPSLDLDQDLSDCDHGQARAARALPATVSEEPPTSLEWDEDDMSYPDLGLEDSGLVSDLVLGACAANISPVHEASKPSDRSLQYRQLSLETSCPSLRDSDSMLTSSLATFELDVDSEIGDPAAPIPELDQQEQEEGIPIEGTYGRDHLHLPLGTPDSSNNNKNNNKSNNNNNNNAEEHQASGNQSPMSPESWPLAEGALTHSSSSSGVSVLSRSLSGLSDAWCSSTAMTPATPATPASTTLIAIGQRVGIQDYALREWQGDTKKAQTILKGYSEIPGLLGLNAIRVVRGDNYCAVRGAIFQALTRGLALPSGQLAASRCSQLISDPSGHWLRSWNFAGRLPYAGDNVENGIRDCLLTIDSTVERLQSASDKESALANMLNNDPWLDARLCEAAKLLMLVGALELKAAADQGQPLPLFAELLFARDTSSTPCDLMNNHLKHVGDTAGLEQVEMFLLGYALGIRIRVVRPSAFGSQDYVCSYPDPEDIGIDMSDGIDNRRLVDLLAEDDRHYNILVA